MCAISGTAGGRAIKGAVVRMTDAQGSVRAVRSSASGEYRFADVAAGETYIFAVYSKQYAFAEPSHARTVVEELDDVDFVATTK